MGICGLWSVIEKCGIPINLKEMIGKCLTVDISIWIQQGICVAETNYNLQYGQVNAFVLRMIFIRITKLLNFGIQPIFVFDGAKPSLKRLTIKKRQKLRQNQKNIYKIVDDKVIYSDTYRKRIRKMLNVECNKMKLDYSNHSKNIKCSNKNETKKKFNDFDRVVSSNKESIANKSSSSDEDLVEIYNSEKMSSTPKLNENEANEFVKDLISKDWNVLCHKSLKNKNEGYIMASKGNMINKIQNTNNKINEYKQKDYNPALFKMEFESGILDPINLSSNTDESIESDLDLEMEYDIKQSDIKDMEKFNLNSETKQIWKNMDIKEMLDLLGVPWVQAPYEAEAQCAYLDVENQCDGIIGNDSDYWAFGGKRLYKNLFHSQKEAKFYSNSQIQHKFDLNRDKCVAFALMCGCDYTPGIYGLGPKKCLNFLNHHWKGNIETSLDYMKDIIDNIMKLKLNDNFRFPDGNVIELFKNPNIVKEKFTFKWFMPQLDNLCQYLSTRTSLNEFKIRNYLTPIIENFDSIKKVK
ncbi:hypothetical protein A3Q56_00938 [Intoshia linei]|uniref:Uncharacterized protein n=1 Tax=Intoshia linei TaxID=1819745 RepID=A0A177BAM2_9BILA|nr:hypothetical protein A3Q56_00938 [Intoshia linei]